MKMKKSGLTVVVFAALLFIVIVPSLSSSPSMEEIEGTLEVVLATDVVKKTCQPIYFINTDAGQRTQFTMPAAAPPNLSPGQKIKISGRWEEKGEEKSFHCGKVSPSIKKATSLTIAYLPEQKPVLGEQKILVVYLSSPDTEDDLPSWDKEKIDDKIFSNKHSLNAYWKACSINNKTGEPKVWLAGDILDGWRKMPKAFTEYGYGSSNEVSWGSEFINDVVQLIDPEIDFSKSKYDGLIIFRAGKKWRYDWSTVGKTTLHTSEGELEISMSFLNEYDIEIDNDYAAHESGHGLFSLIHAKSKSVNSGEMYDYGDMWDNRGGSYALLDNLHRYILGWLDESQIKVITSSDDIWLDQRELSSQGIKLLVIPLGFNVGWDGATNPILIYMENHCGLGEFDSQLSFYNSNNNVDPNNLVLYKKYQVVDQDYDSLVYIEEEDVSGPKALDLESQFCDSEYENLDHYGICVQVLEKTGEGAESKVKVSITLTSDYSVPTPIPTPSPKEMTLFVTINEISVTNNEEVAVSRGNWVRVIIQAGTSDGDLVEILQADKIVCKITNPKGKLKLSEEQDNVYEGAFNFKLKRKAPLGEYWVEIAVYEDGYHTASFQASFKAQ